MNGYIKLIGIIIFVLYYSLLWAENNGDWQYRALGSINKSLSNNWRVQIGYQSHFGKAGTDHKLFKNITDLSLWYLVNKNLIVSIDYKQEYTRENEDWLIERRPHVNLRVRWEWLKLLFEDKSRIELRYFENSAFESRYRNRLWIRFPLQYFNLSIQPYVANEIFFNLNADGFNRNRIYLGLMVRINKIQPEVVGFWQITDEQVDWIQEFVLAFRLMLFL
jgi:hypothetical protein